MNILVERLRETLSSVIPIVVIVLVLNFLFVPLGTSLLLGFLIGSVLVAIGLSFFLIGVDIGITPLGELTGIALAKTNKLWFVVIAGFILGFFISIAEPGLLVMANQVQSVTGGDITSTSILVVVSIGLALTISLGFIRIFCNVPLYKILTVLYGLIFLLAIFTSPEFLAISFDASGATTGLLAVPFILALSVGISALKKDSKSAEKDSFGLIAIASTGAIISVMILNILSNPGAFPSGLQPDTAEATGVLQSFFRAFPEVFRESILALAPLLVIFLFLQKVAFKLKSKSFKRLLKGFVYAFLGLLLFLLGVNAGFMEVGSELGHELASMDNKFNVIFVGLILGVVTILAEPAVHVLTHQVEEVTSGYVKRSAVLIALSTGVGIAVALSIVRVLVPPIQLWHYLLPGYLIALGLMYIVPKLFVGIAFDAGGVATGPMTATFILAFTTGAAEAFEGANVLIDGFGMIAMVALTPIMTLQILGYIFARRSGKKGVDEGV